MNYSIAFLKLSSVIQRCPYFTQSIQKIPSFMTFYKSDFSYFLNSIVRTSSDFSTLKIDKSFFSHILETSLILSADKFTHSFFSSNSLIESHRTPLLISPSIINNSIFRLCVSTHDGGAIFALCDLFLSQCLFEYNTSPKKGGSIFSQGSLSIISSTFDSGYTPLAAGIYNDMINNSYIFIQKTIFVSLESTNSTCVYRNAMGEFHFNESNISYCSADYQNSGFTIFDNHFIVTHSIFMELTAAKDSAFLIYSTFERKSHLIDSSSFWLIKSSYSHKSSTILSIYDCIPAVQIQKCDFHSTTFNSPAFLPINSIIFLFNACSTDPLLEFLGTNTDIRKNIHVNSESSFDTMCNIPLPDIGVIGYASVQKNTSTKYFNLTAIIIMSLIVFSSFLIGLFFALIISGELTHFFNPSKYL